MITLVVLMFHTSIQDAERKIPIDFEVGLKVHNKKKYPS